MRTRGILLLAAAVIGAGALTWWLTAAPPKARIFVSNYDADTVSVLEEPAGEIAVLPVGKAPQGLAVRRGDAPLVAIANSSADYVTLVDPRTLEIVGNVPVGVGPEYVAFSPDGAWLYVTSPYDLTVTVVDVARREPVGTPLALDRKPGQLAVGADGRVYALLRADEGAVAVIDPASRTVTATIPVGRSPSAIAFGNGRVLAASFDDSTIAVIDPTAARVVATHEVETGSALAAHADRPVAYSMATFDNVIYAFDVESGEILAEITTGDWPNGGALTADGRFLWVVNEESDNVAKVDTSTNAVVHRLVVGKGPVAVAVYEPGR